MLIIIDCWPDLEDGGWKGEGSFQFGGLEVDIPLPQEIHSA